MAPAYFQWFSFHSNGKMFTQFFYAVWYALYIGKFFIFLKNEISCH